MCTLDAIDAILFLITLVFLFSCIMFLYLAWSLQGVWDWIKRHDHVKEEAKYEDMDV